MNKTKIIILFFFCCISGLYAIDFDLEEITLPYDNLDLQELYVTNSTITCRSGNKIYKSTDDGISWDIVLDSKQKINQFYSLNPHTMFVVGDSGLVYQTMDYGNTWIDLSLKTDSSLVQIAAKDNSDFLVLTNKQFVFHKDDSFPDWITFNNYYDKTILQSVVYAENKYFFGGRSNYVRTEVTQEGDTYDEFNFPAFEFKDNIITNYTIDHNYVGIDDSLKLFNLDNKLYCSSVYDNRTCVSRNKIFSIYDQNASNVFWFDRIVKPFIIKDQFFFFMKSLKVISYDTLPATKWPIRSDTISLNIDKINDVFSQRDSLFYITSNNSRIYKLRLKETISNVENKTENSLISQQGNQLFFDTRITEFAIYNYLGAQIISNNSYGTNGINLKFGVYIISYKYQNSYFTKKILIDY